MFNRKWLWRTLVVCVAVGGAFLGSYVHAHAATRPAAPAAAKSFTVVTHGPHRCYMRGNGLKSGGSLSLRITKDTCSDSQMRMRVAGQGVLPDRTYYGNWVDDNRQRTSVDISPNVYSDYGYDWQCNWPKHAAHRCRVRYVSKDNGAAPTRAASVATSGGMVCVKHPSPRNCPAVITNLGAWSAAQRPTSWSAGNGHAPWLTGLRWTVDQHSTGKAHGILHTYKTACLKGPNPSGCKAVKVKVSVTFTTPKFHCGNVPGLGCQGGWFWKIMNWKFPGSGLAAQHRWVVSKRGYFR